MLQALKFYQRRFSNWCPSRFAQLWSLPLTLLQAFLYKFLSINFLNSFLLCNFLNYYCLQPSSSVRGSPSVPLPSHPYPNLPLTVNPYTTIRFQPQHYLPHCIQPTLTFSYISRSLIYCSIRKRCNKLNVVQAGRRLTDRFTEHLRDVSLRINTPVAHNFLLANHTTSNVSTTPFPLHYRFTLPPSETVLYFQSRKTNSFPTRHNSTPLFWLSLQPP